MIERKNVNSIRTMNPISTGGVGFTFEKSIQSYFIFLMMTDGLVPKMPNCKIEKLVFQSHDFKTDDCIVFAKDANGRHRKLLVQIKIGKTAQICSPDFKEAIDDAWHDFQNNQFDKLNDKIFFITGELNSADGNLLTILDDHIHKNNLSESFWASYSGANCFGKKAKEKFEKIIEYITIANNDNRPSEKELFDFFKIFYVIKSDLHDNAINEGGINLSLIQSRLDLTINGKKFKKSPQSIWDGLLRFAGDHNNGEDFSRDHEELVDLFEQQTVIELQKKDPLSNPLLRTNKISDPESAPIITSKYPGELVILGLIGSFNERNPADIKIVERIFDDCFKNIKPKLQKMLLGEKNLMFFKNGVWRTSHDRKEIIHSFSNHIFDDHIDSFNDIYIEILDETNFMLNLPKDQQYVPSKTLRSGVANGMAILANNPDWFTNCTANKISDTAYAAVQKLIEDSVDPKSWISLSDYMVPIAETCPSKFLEILETILSLEDNPFIKLTSGYSQAAPFASDNLSGLRWALADLAWDEKFCARTCAILIKLANIEPARSNGQSYCVDTIVETILPWRPQTMANSKIRYAIVNNALKDNPKIGRKVLECLLPNKTTTQIEHPLPLWRNNIVDADWDKNITNQEVWEQYNEYSKMYAEHANGFTQIIDTIDNIHHLTKDGLDIFTKKLSNTASKHFSDAERIDIWDKLLCIIEYDKQHLNSKNSLPEETAAQLQVISEVFAPKDAYRKYARLFSHYDYELIHHNDYKTGENELKEERKKALRALLAHNGFDEIIKLVNHAKYPDQIGSTLALINDNKLDKKILPQCLNGNNEKCNNFAKSFVSSRFYNLPKSSRWKWVNGINQKTWTVTEIVEFAKSLPFTEKTWRLINSHSEDAQRMRRAYIGNQSKMYDNTIIRVFHPRQLINY